VVVSITPQAPPTPQATTFFDGGAAEAQFADLVEPAFAGGDQPAPAFSRLAGRLRRAM
jgi:hypothetical protein